MRGHILTTDQSVAGCAGIFSRTATGEHVTWFAAVHRWLPTTAMFEQVRGVVWSSEDAESGPQHRLQTANQGG
eukprot:7004516-Pyramimonas_sp.AAC.1